MIGVRLQCSHPANPGLRSPSVGGVSGTPSVTDGVCGFVTADFCSCVGVHGLLRNSAVVGVLTLRWIGVVLCYGDKVGFSFVHAFP